MYSTLDAYILETVIEKTPQEEIYDNVNTEELIEADGATKITAYFVKKFKVADDVLIHMGFDEFKVYYRAIRG